MKQFKVPSEIITKIIFETKRFGNLKDNRGGWTCYLTDIGDIGEPVNNSDYLLVTMHRIGDFYELNGEFSNDIINADIIESASEALAGLCIDDVLFSDKSYPMISRDESLPIDTCQLLTDNNWVVDVNPGLGIGEEKSIEYIFKFRAEVRHNIKNRVV